MLSIERSVQRTLREVVFFTDSPDGLAFKVTLTCDDPLSAHELEEVVTTAAFCIQHPRQLLLGDWKYDFARSWSAATKSAAESLQRAGNRELYTVDIHLLNRTSLASYDDAAISQFMITRMLQLIHTLAGGVAITGAKCILQTPGESLASSFQSNGVETV